MLILVTMGLGVAVAALILPQAADHPMARSVTDLRVVVAVVEGAVWAMPQITGSVKRPFMVYGPTGIGAVPADQERRSIAPMLLVWHTTNAMTT